MNNSNLYFDGALGRFIRKEIYDQVSVDSNLTAQHGLACGELTVGAGFNNHLKLYISHASGLDLSTSQSVSFDMVTKVAPYNQGNLPIYTVVDTTGAYISKPAGTSDVCLFSTNIIEFDPEKYPRVQLREISIQEAPIGWKFLSTVQGVYGATHFPFFFTSFNHHEIRPQQNTETLSAP